MGGGLTLILGGARSGKSSRAEALAKEVGGGVLFVATAEPGDEEMQVRIHQHQSQRPTAWETVEAPRDVGEAVERSKSTADVVIIDCLTLLVSNCMGEGGSPEDMAGAEGWVDEELDGILAAYAGSGAQWILISNEVGLGIVPAYPLGRAYRDLLGRANQRMAEEADRVIFMVAGLPMIIK